MILVKLQVEEIELDQLRLRSSIKTMTARLLRYDHIASSEGEMVSHFEAAYSIGLDAYLAALSTNLFFQNQQLSIV
jgi:hypothetical protein